MKNKYSNLFKELQIEKDSLPQNVNDNVLIFDGLNTFIRLFSASPATDDNGEHVGGIVGFLHSVGKTIRDLKPSRCIIVFDGVGGSARRKAMTSDYKANRANKTKMRRYDHVYSTIEEEQQAMRYQSSRLIEYLDQLPITILSIDGIEADDTITYISDYLHEESNRITIVSTDRDFYQLIDDKVRVWSPTKKKMYDKQRIKDEYGVTPTNYVAYRSFTGDASDNVDGIKGIGPKTIIKLLPELTTETEFTIDDIIDKSKTLISENKKYQQIVNEQDKLHLNNKLMNLKLLNFSGNLKSNIRNIVDYQIPRLNKNEFKKMYMEDRLWTAMKNPIDWINITWMTLDSFAAKTYDR